MSGGGVIPSRDGVERQRRVERSVSLRRGDVARPRDRRRVRLRLRLRGRLRLQPEVLQVVGRQPGTQVRHLPVRQVLDFDIAARALDEVAVVVNTISLFGSVVNLAV